MWQAILASLLSGGKQMLNTGFEWALNQFSGLSKSEKQQNEFNASEAQKQRDFSASEAAIGRDFSAQQAEVERDWQEEMYSKYNSLQGKIQQARDSGVNPMFAVTGSATSPMSASAGVASSPSASGVAASGHSSRGPNIDMVGAALGFSKLKAELDNINAQTERTRVETRRQEILASYDGELTETRIAEMRQNIDAKKQDVNESIERARTYAQNISESNKRIEVMGKQIELMGSQMVLNATQSALNKLNADKLSALLPYVQARQEAEIGLITANTSESLASAEKAMYDANMSMLEGMVKADLIDKGYYDNIVSQSQYDTERGKWSSKREKREYKWSPIDHFCTNFSRVCIGLGSFGSAVTDVVKNMPVAAAAPIGF